MEEIMSLAEVVRVYRNQRRLSLMDVAKSAGCSKGHVWQIERGIVTNPTVQTIIGIAGALSLAPEIIFASAAKGVAPLRPTA